MMKPGIKLFAEQERSKHLTSTVIDFLVLMR